MNEQQKDKEAREQIAKMRHQIEQRQEAFIVGCEYLGIHKKVRDIPPTSPS